MEFGRYIYIFLSFCKTCFEKVNLVQCDWCIVREQFNTNFPFASVLFHPQETLGEHRKMPPLEPNHTEIHKHNTHPHPLPVLQPSVKFQVSLLPPLHNNSPAPTFLTGTSTCKLQVFFKSKCHVYYSINVLLNHLTSVKLLPFLLGSYPFFMCHW